MHVTAVLAHPNSKATHQVNEEVFRYLVIAMRRQTRCLDRTRAHRMVQGAISARKSKKLEHIECSVNGTSQSERHSHDRTTFAVKHDETSKNSQMSHDVMDHRRLSSLTSWP